MTAVAPARAEKASAPAGALPRIAVQVRSIGGDELDQLCPVLEGRLLAKVGTQPGYRLVQERDPAEYRLLLELAELQFNASGSYDNPYDAEANPNKRHYTQTIGAELSLDLTLAPLPEGASLYEDTMEFTASRPVEPPDERLHGQIIDDLLERVAERVPKILKKRLPH